MARQETGLLVLEVILVASFVASPKTTFATNLRIAMVINLMLALVTLVD